MIYVAVFVLFIQLVLTSTGVHDGHPSADNLHTDEVLLHSLPSARDNSGISILQRSNNLQRSYEWQGTRILHFLLRHHGSNSYIWNHSVSVLLQVSSHNFEEQRTIYQSQSS